MTDAEKKNTTFRDLCISLYGAYALSGLVELIDNELISLAGLLGMTMAWTIVYFKKKAMRDTPYASHLRWMDRTMWIGSLVIFPVFVCIAIVVLFAVTDTSLVSASLTSGDPDLLMNGLQSYLAQYKTRIDFIEILSTALPVAWWVRRCWIGYVLVRGDKPVEKVTSWL